MIQINNCDLGQEKVKFFVNNLKSLKDKIESVNIFHQIEILRIFNDNNVCITENKIIGYALIIIKNIYIF